MWNARTNNLPLKLSLLARDSETVNWQAFGPGPGKDDKDGEQIGLRLL